MNDAELSKLTIAQYQDPEYALSYSNAIEDAIDPWQFEKLMEYTPIPARILDVACAAGRDSNYLDQHGFEVTGIDISEPLISEAKKRYPNIEFIIGDFTRLPFKENSFDSLWVKAGLVHSASQKEVKMALVEFRRVLKNNGTMAIITKSRNKDDNETIVRIDKLSQKSRFFRFQEPESFSKLVESIGFQLLYQRIFNENEVDYRDKSKLRDENWVILIAKKTKDK